MLTRSAQAATVHNEETAKLRAAKESLEAAQVAAQKKQEAELERLRTQLVFKQHEMESSRKAAVSRAPVPPAPSQAPAPSQQVPRWDVPRTPRRQHRPPAAAQQSPSPHRPKRPASKAQQHVLLPGFVNDFVMPLAAKKGKGIARAHHASQNQGMRERDLVPQLPPPRTQIDEHMDYGDGQPTEIDFHMDFGDDFRAPRPQHVAGGTARPFDWLGWVRFFFLVFLSVRAQRLIDFLIDETTRLGAFDVTDCPKYNPTLAHTTTVRCEPRDNVLSGLHVPHGRRSRKCRQLRSHCTRCCRFTGTNSKYTLNWRSSESWFSPSLFALIT